MSHNPNDIFSKKRFGLITGSKCYILFPDRGDGKVGMRTYAKELANRMYFQFYDNNNTWQTEHGNLSESSANDHYKMFIDETAEYQPKFAVHGLKFGGSGDAICKTRGVDYKCPASLNGWLDYIHDGISKQQYHQCQMYMHLYKRDEWDVAAYLLETNRMSNNGETYPVPREKRMIITRVVKQEGWWEKLEENAEYVIEQRDIFYSKLIEQFNIIRNV